MSCDPVTEEAFIAPATLTIDLENLHHNLEVFKDLLAGETRIMAMVKGDAYGCGLSEVGQCLQDAGVAYLGVAYLVEGIELRSHGIELPIMVMNPSPQQFSELVRYRLEPELSNAPLMRQWGQFIQSSDIFDYPVHLEVDTGMKRLGFDPNEIKEVAQILQKNPGIHIRSVFSHLAASADPSHDEFTRGQFKSYESWYEELTARLSYKPLRHILNSGGISRFSGYQYDMVRLGIGLYGVGLEALSVHQALRPVQSLHASVTQVREVGKGESVGYDRRGIMKKSGKIAVINLGYADGFPRAAGNGRFSVLIENTRCPTVGSVCMDMTMVDVSECPETRPGSVAEIYGSDRPVLALAEAVQTIPYEVITANHQRLNRRIRNASF